MGEFISNCSFSRHGEPMELQCIPGLDSKLSAQGNVVHACVLSRFTRVLFVTPRTAAHQAPLSMGFSRQEYWSGLPCPSPEDPPDPGIKPTSPALAGGFFTTSAAWEAPRGALLRSSAPGVLTVGLTEAPREPPLVHFLSESKQIAVFFSWETKWLACF